MRFFGLGGRKFKGRKLKGAEIRGRRKFKGIRLDRVNYKFVQCDQNFILGKTEPKFRHIQ